MTDEAHFKTYMDTKIEKGIPIPNGRVGKKYPFAQMEVGDSFVSDAKAQAAAGQMNMVRKPKRWICRTIEDGKVRIWRVA